MRKESGAKPRNPPDAAMLRAAAIAHLARYAATEAGLAQVLARKIDRWARTATLDPSDVKEVSGKARACINGIVQQLAASGAVSDTAFAQGRARALARGGRSRRAVGAHLAARGVPAELAADATPSDDATELAAALIHARKRRLGPWRKAEGTPEILRRELGSFARAGFAQSVASRALRFDRDTAEEAIAAFRAEI